MIIVVGNYKSLSSFCGKIRYKSLWWNDKGTLQMPKSKWFFLCLMDGRTGGGEEWSKLANTRTKSTRWPLISLTIPDNNYTKMLLLVNPLTARPLFMSSSYENRGIPLLTSELQSPHLISSLGLESEDYRLNPFPCFDQGKLRPTGTKII